MILKDRYKIEKRIGEGAMAKVYLAMDTQHNRPVAIKQISPPPEMFDVHTAIKRFEREYQFLSSINHPNIIRAYDFFEHQSHTFMVLEYVQGFTLEHVFRNYPRPDLKRLVNLALHIAYGVEVINLAGILHRDLKPSNIIVNNRGIKILDLGIGKHMNIDVTRLSEHGSFIGTIEYASPDQFSGKVTANSDVFSLGVILYQLFTWQPHSPFLEHDIPSTLTKIVTQDLPSLVHVLPPQLYNENKPFYDDFSRLLTHALQKGSDDRIADAMTFVAKLETITKGHIYHQITPQEVYQTLSAQARDELKQIGDRHGRTLPQASQKKPQTSLGQTRVRRRRMEAQKRNKAFKWLVLSTAILLVIVTGVIWYFS
ncbi:serine/threonine protein kinase [Candidatus Uabimicrobium amorphum]|uniref:Protein kinase n=1 Tax=Uabimicrobium amorphum TaxID=2596890 RepID=A0A5S9IKR7_UABAM|nr:serine/threonine-protein kinase [Candidatus Uabimicrobium amorphum]BBM83683.1 protein kinase [Candidatus Uabimicrobium amorphum]